MSNYINGAGYPRVLIKTISDGLFVYTIDLDLCMSGGLTESYAEDFQRVILENNKIVDYDNRASRITFRLDYSEYVKKANLFLIEQIFFYNSLPETYSIHLMPNYDVPSRVFEVRLADGSYQLGRLSGGTLAKGNKLPIIEFITTNTVSKNFTDIDLLLFPNPYYVAS